MKSKSNLSLNIEALLFSSNRPLSQMEILMILSEKSETDIDSKLIANEIEFLKEKYHSNNYAFEIVESGGGYQFLTKKSYHPLIIELNGSKYIKKLSNSALETLAIIAYKQPVTKVDIEEIRGVSSDYSIQRLLERELIFIYGRKEDSIGKPLLYRTTKNFMDYLGINSAEDLPQMKEIRNTEVINPTEATHAIPEEINFQIQN